MQSEIIDVKEVKEKYSNNGRERTRTHTIRAMNNNNSKFINYRCGRQSVNINKDILEVLIDTVNSLNWDKSAQKQEPEPDIEQETLLEHIKQLQRQITELKKGKGNE